MTAQKFADLKGVSRQAVHKAVERGDIPSEATAWRGKGHRRVLVITNVRLASTWTPAEQPASLAEEKPGPLTDDTSAREAKRILLIFKAKQARLEFEKASGLVIETAKVMEIYGRQIQAAKTKIMALGKLARSHIPHLTVDDSLTIEDLCRESLEELAAEAIRDDEPAGKKS